ncbi:MAG: peptide-methionine (S)-S-oxide reductase MsrA [Burkholderiaceae bacterium]|nr:peptide-methionine (S)-S-oxide reductase MsrA [Burkholderiaceae bacterium]
MLMRSGFSGLAARLAVPALVALAPALGSCAESVTQVPPPVVDESAPTGTGQEIAVLAGGCFWGVQAVFQHVKGVTQAVSGYAGGGASTAQYETVSSGATGHAESVQITFDPRQISYGRILQIYFSVVQDPTQLNRQGPDSGTQYRSDIFAMDESQKHVAQRYIEQLNQARVFHGPIMTKVDTYTGFYPAEAYHQDFATLHPNYPYIVFNDAPKVENLKRLFPAQYQSTPALVGGEHAAR